MMEFGNAEFAIDWAEVFNGGSDYLNLDFFDQPAAGGVSSSPDAAGVFSIGDLEQFLMNDADDDLDQNIFADGLSPDSLFDSSSGSGVDTAKDPPTTPEAAKIVADEESEEGRPVIVEGSEMAQKADDNDPATKKRKRQMRNRDAAVRSRERKREYLKDLEMKSKYYEAECKRLGFLLQYHVAENQALRLSLNHQRAFDASMSKQESAVLLLESLLLGSLLGFMGIIWLLLLPGLHLQALKTSLRIEAGVADGAARKAGNKVMKLTYLSFMLSKKCRGTRPRMKQELTSFLCVVRNGEC